MKRLPRQVRSKDGDHRLAAFAKGDARYEAHVDGATFPVEAGALDGGGFWFRGPDGRRHVAWAAMAGERLQVRVDGHTWTLDSAEEGRAAGGDTAADPSHIVAPMTGTIVKVLVEEGDDVDENDDVVVLTAMKMEHRLKAARSGRVAEVRASEGETVDAGATLVRIE